MLSAPLIGGVFNLEHGRGFWLNFSIAMGFVALSMMGAQFVLVSRMQWVSQPIGMDALLAFHKGMAYVATAFAFAHPTILFIQDDKYWPLLNVFTSPLRAKFAVAATLALILLMVFSIFRQQLRMRYKIWQMLHWLLALVAVVGSFMHALLVNYYLKDPWEQMIWMVLSGVFVALALVVRVVKPVLRFRRRWQVESVQPGVAGTATVVLKLVNLASYGRHGFVFKAGQFAWVTARRSPFALTYNPFSIASSACVQDRIRFTIKAHQGFSAEVADLKVGEWVYVDGPHGTFYLDGDSDSDDAPLVLIGAGVGITPLLSMLETLADQRSLRPCHLWLANKDATSIVCEPQIEALRQLLNLQVVLVFSAPADGPKQRLDEDFVRQHLPPDHLQASYFVCGPNALMDMAETLLPALGVPRHQIHTERFGMV